MTTIEQTSRFFRFRKLRDRRTCSLEVNNITVVNDDDTVLLDELRLELEPGTKTCIVSSDGPAQAALLSALIGETKVSSGSIFLNGVDISLMSTEDLGNTVALVPQDPWIKHASIRENLTFGLQGISTYQIEWAARLTQLDAFARYLPDGLDTVVSDGRDAGTIVPSMGQRRRIGLARALLRNPSILVLEEPTTDLSSAEEQLLLRSLDKIVAGRTLIVASHRMRLARRADNVLVLHNGKLEPYDEAATQGTINDHAKLWDRRMPPSVAAPATRRQSIRLVRPTPLAVSDPWGITVGKELVPGYVASGLVGRTEHTDVWAAWSTAKEGPVRVKVPAQAPVTYHAYEQLQREFRMASSLRHPGLGRAHEVDLDAEMPYAVFEYLDSPSLRSLVTKLGRGLDALDVLYVGFELAGALNYLHHRGRVHLNLRARHIRTRSDTIVIADFSQCRTIGSRLPAPIGSGNGHRGEHRAVAPEQQAGAPAHPKMDIYSLGALMHYAAAGAVMAETTVRGPRLTPFSTLLESAPISLTELVDRMLAEDPADRPDAEEVLTRFRRVLPQSLHRPRITDLEQRPHLQLVVSNN
jgi:ABC-type multidrug transport system ATPase subunit